MRSNPYTGQPDKAFWKKTVAVTHYMDLTELASLPCLDPGIKIGTAGSCFAQHVTRHIKQQGLTFLDAEPRPENIPADRAQDYGYDMYSCRYGNVYSVKQLLQLIREAYGIITIKDIVWERSGRFYDSQRPSVTPDGYSSVEEVAASRKEHLSRVRFFFENVDLFVFTLGLTECWVNSDGEVFPTAPGVTAGEYDPEKYHLHNSTHSEILWDLNEFWSILKSRNAGAPRMILTVSPVALAATATDKHVLVANTYSKSVLRAVAGEICDLSYDIYYFPSYEIINSHPSRAMFYEPDLRSVNPAGVSFVMKHFFNSQMSPEIITDENILCDEDDI